jgi:hypothetical protein
VDARSDLVQWLPGIRALTLCAEVTMLSRRCSLLAFLLASLLVSLVSAAERVPVGAEGNTSEARMKKDITYLASDELEGRGMATRGLNLAADYIAGEFRKAGLQPGGKDGSYFQPFSHPGHTLDGRPTLVLRGPRGQVIELQQGVDFEALGMAPGGKVTAAPLAFAGYGITASAKDGGYNDYENLDAAGKVVIVLRYLPRGDVRYKDADKKDVVIGLGGDRRKYASFTEKLANAEKHKAAAVLFLHDHEAARDGDPLLPYGYTSTANNPVKLPALFLRRSVADSLLRSSLDSSLGQREEDIDRTFKPQSASLDGWTASLEVKAKPAIELKNVVGVLEGKGPLAKETVVIGAHYDHWGYGGAGSLSGLRTPAIHHGADDNGSGTTTVIELARRFGAQANREGRRLVFVCFSGEEQGLWGSEHYVKAPPFPLADTVAMVNFDMVGRLRPDSKTQKDRVIVGGTGTAKTFDALIENLNNKYGFTLKKQATGLGPSDHMNFYLKQVPVFWFFTDDHPDYHRPSDTAEKINVAGMRRIADLAEELITNLATAEKRPEYVKVAGGGGGGPGGPGGPRLGIRPEYGDTEDGVLVKEVGDGGPAAKGGIKPGDRIIEMGGKPVKNLEAYVSLLKGHKKGDVLDVTVLRDGKKVPLKVTLE